MYVRICVFATERQIKIKLSLCLRKHDAIETHGIVELSGQFLAMAALLPGENPAVLIEWEAAWTSEPVWALS